MTEKIVVVSDTREQQAYSFSPDRIQVMRRALPAGDYSLAGLEYEVAVERKTLEDFVHTVIRERSRFRSELKKLQTYTHSCVVVEANMEDVLAGAYQSGAHPNSVFGAAISIIVDYDVPVYFCSNRQVARRFVEEFLLRCHGRLQASCNPVLQETISGSEEKSSGSSIHPLGSPRADS